MSPVVLVRILISSRLSLSIIYADLETDQAALLSAAGLSVGMVAGARLLENVHLYAEPFPLVA